MFFLFETIYCHSSNQFTHVTPLFVMLTGLLEHDNWNGILWTRPLQQQITSAAAMNYKRILCGLAFIEMPSIFFCIRIFVSFTAQCIVLSCLWWIIVCLSHSSTETDFYFHFSQSAKKCKKSDDFVLFFFFTFDKAEWSLP